MNSNDLHTLLTAPTVSRAEFFAQLPAEPGPQPETPPDELPTSTVPESRPPSAPPLPPAATGFPA